MRCEAARVIAGLACLCAVLPAQSPRSLHVIVRDRQNQPVTDPGVADFRVFDQGKARPIVFARAGVPGQAMPGGAPFHITVILFDLLSLNPSEIGDVTKQIDNLLPSESSDGWYVDLLTNQGEIYPVRGSQLLDDAVHQAVATPTRESSIAATYRALESLARQIASIPGRKEIMWITHGVPVSIPVVDSLPADYSKTLQSLGALFDRAGTAVDPVEWGGEPLGTRAARNQPMAGPATTLEELASLTGGKWYSNGDLRSAIGEVKDAPRAGYTIVYDAPAADGKFHSVRVTSSRKDVRIQVKRGYVAETDRAALDQEREDAVISSPFDASGIGVRGNVSSGATPQSVQVAAVVDATDVLLVRSGDNYTAHLNLTVVSCTADGQKSVSAPESVTVNLTAQEREKAIRDGIPIGTFTVSTATIKAVRIVVQDPGSDGIGSSTIPLS